MSPFKWLQIVMLKTASSMELQNKESCDYIAIEGHGNFQRGIYGSVSPIISILTFLLCVVICPHIFIKDITFLQFFIDSEPQKVREKQYNLLSFINI